MCLGELEVGNNALIRAETEDVPRLSVRQPPIADTAHPSWEPGIGGRFCPWNAVERGND